MSYVIRTTAESDATFNQNYDYLSVEWSDSVLDQFIDRVDSIVQQIRNNPFQFSLHSYRANVRKATINKRIVLYFHIIDNTTIELLTFWNTYRDPKDLKF